MKVILYALVPLIAFLYSSVGFGGATGYLAAMSFFDIPPRIMASTALVLNILVASISFFSYYRAGHLRRDLLIPFVAASVPAAFAGGYIKITDQTYTLLLYSVLTYVGFHLLFFSRAQDDRRPMQPIVPVWSLLIGLGIGMLSGMVGIGGGIFLSPVIIYAHWGNPKQASATAAAFIVLNSISGLFGRISGGTFALNSLSLSLLPLGICGALAGSYFGAQRLNHLNLRRALGTVMILVISNFWLNFWG